MSKTIYRHNVPVDGQWHTIALTGDVVFIATRHVDLVEVWSMHDDDRPLVTREFQVFGTGQLLPDDEQTVYVASTLAGQYLVWHLFERIKG